VSISPINPEETRNGAKLLAVLAVLAGVVEYVNAQLDDEDADRQYVLEQVGARLHDLLDESCDDAPAAKCRCCPPGDPSPCSGNDRAVRVIDRHGDVAVGCVEHAAKMVNAVRGTRIEAADGDSAAAVRAYRRVKELRGPVLPERIIAQLRDAVAQIRDVVPGHGQSTIEATLHRVVEAETRLEELGEYGLAWRIRTEITPVLVNGRTANPAEALQGVHDRLTTVLCGLGVTS
jgi:hypothetical protein